ncbi:MAG: hypothetical protein IPO35_09580 [Uliginosibacterium sp.]|nr:hypothetical protein [Uliginosibacterium sp.]
MDHATLQTLARIKIRLRHEKGVVLNTQRFFTDTRYALQLLDLAEESEDLELVTAALDIRNQLGWIQDPIMPTAAGRAPSFGATQTPQGSANTPANTGRYVFGARS